MGEKDITEKILEDHNDVFADIINGLICRRTENLTGITGKYRSTFTVQGRR